MEFDNRTVLVTGSSRNIGRATALAFARQGANVAITAVSRKDELNGVADEIRALGRKAMPCIVDTSDQAAVQAMASRVLAEFGHVDVLVINAAIRPGVSFTEMTYEDWRHVLDVNLDSAFHCAKAFLPGMLEQHWGRIITFGGVHAFQLGAANRVHVGASKGALLGFTRCLAVEVGRTGVTVNMVAPGAIDTVRDRDMVPGEEIPAGRRGTTDEIAAACCYLASEGAAYVTGQMLSVNGGLSMG